VCVYIYIYIYMCVCVLMTSQFCVVRISGRLKVNGFLRSSQAITGSGVFATGLFTVEYQAWG